MGLAPFGSQMNADFYEAMLSFTVAMTACLTVPPRPQEEGVDGSTISLDAALRRAMRPSTGLVLLSAALLAGCLLLNLIWW